MKKIRVCSIHSDVHSLNDFIESYCLKPIFDNYEFIWDNLNPEYVVVGEQWFSKFDVFSHFRDLWKDGRNKDRVFIAFYGEAVKPDLNLFDYAIGYDASLELNDRIGSIPPRHIFFRNFVLPKARPAANEDEAKSWLKEKTKFCNFMYSHAFKERDDLFLALNQYKPVDALGSRFHNTDFQPTGYAGFYEETTTLRHPYKFTIAGENGDYDGYTSEKLMTALQANTVPIYWGHKRIDEDFNPKAFIHARDFGNLDELVQYVRRVDEDDDLWCQYICEPWQTEAQVAHEQQRLQEYYAFWEHIFAPPLADAKRLEYSSHMHIYQDWIWNNPPERKPSLWERAKKHLPWQKKETDLYW